MFSLSLPPHSSFPSFPNYTLPSESPPLWAGHCQVQVAWRTFTACLDRGRGRGLLNTAHWSSWVTQPSALGTVVDTCFVRRTEAPGRKEEWETGLGLDKKGTWTRSSCLGCIYALHLRHLGTASRRVKWGGKWHLIEWEPTHAWCALGRTWHGLTSGDLSSPPSR